MILTGNQNHSGPQVLIANSQSESQQSPAIKLLTNSTSSYGLTSSTKTITLAQAQQMGLLSTNKVQHILPSSSQKQVSCKIFNIFLRIGVIYFLSMNFFLYQGYHSKQIDTNNSTIKNDPRFK